MAVERLPLALAKIVSPLDAWELASKAVPEGIPAKPLLALVVGGETFLGAAMCLRWIRGLGPSLFGLLFMTGLLLLLKWRVEDEIIRCGCFGRIFGSTLDTALVEDVVLVGVHVALILWARFGRRA